MNLSESFELGTSNSVNQMGPSPTKDTGEQSKSIIPSERGGRDKSRHAEQLWKTRLDLGAQRVSALLPAGLAVLGPAPDATGSAHLLAPGRRKLPHSLRMHHPMPFFFLLHIQVGVHYKAKWSLMTSVSVQIPCRKRQQCLNWVIWEAFFKELLQRHAQARRQPQEIVQYPGGCTDCTIPWNSDGGGRWLVTDSVTFDWETQPTLGMLQGASQGICTLAFFPSLPLTSCPCSPLATCI